MKKVRLFAIAAAMGMLATTVSAAEAVTYKANWTNVPEGEIVRAELGGNIIAPQLGAEITKYVASSTGNASKTCVKPDGTTAIDANLDGVADQVFYTTNRSDAKVNDFWFFTDAKFVPTPTTMKYYVGMAKNAAGGRIIYPGQDAQEGIINAPSHKFVPFSDAAGIDALLAQALANGKATIAEDEDGYLSYTLSTNASDYDYAKRVYQDHNGAWQLDETTLVKYQKSITEEVIDAADIATRVARANEDAKEEVLKYITGLNSEDGVRKTVKYSYFNINDTEKFTNGGAKVDWTNLAGEGDNEYNVYVTNTITFDADDFAKPFGVTGKIAPAGVAKSLNTLTVYGVNKSGQLVAYYITNGDTTDEFVKGTSIKLSNATDPTVGTTLTNTIILVDETKGLSTNPAAPTEIDNLDDLDITLVNNAAERNNVKQYDKVWDAENEEFVKVTRVYPSNVSDASRSAFSVEKTNELIDKFGGYYSVNTPKNTSDKFVVHFNLGAYDGSGFDNKLDGVLSKSKMTLTYASSLIPENHVGVATNKSYVVKVLDFSDKYNTNNYLPAFDTEAEAVQYMNAMAGLKIAESGYVSYLEKYAIAATAINKPKDQITVADMPNKVVLSSGADSTPFSFGSFKVALDHDRTLIDGTKVAYVPKNTLDHTTAALCVYMGAGEKLESTAYTVTNNLSEIDAQSYGVKNLVYTAKVGEKVVDTKTIKVVIAPKYERTWVAGRVKTLKAFHLNGALYAHYDYDYAKKVVKVTFFELDGVTVASSAEFPL